MPNDTWVVTTYFNPCGYFTRKRNFDLFLEGMNGVGANLLVVELAFGDRAFEIERCDNILRFRGTGVMWQKERLVNLATTSLPASCTKVVWLDCDLLFHDGEWLRRTSEALEQFTVLQPFGRCVHLERNRFLPPYEGAGPGLEWESIGAVFSRDPTLVRTESFRSHGHTGFAWAARRELLDACGLYEHCLTGSADHLMAHAFSGTLRSPCIPKVIGTGAHAEHFANWAARVDRIVQGRMGYVPGRILHLWHGTIADRRYYQMNQEFKAFDFDPAVHLRLDDNGLWNWSSPPPGMKQWASQMFLSRNEDGDRRVPDGEWEGESK